MLIKKAADIRSSEITPKELYVRRREFIQAATGAAIGVAGSLALPGLDDAFAQTGVKLPNVQKSPLSALTTDKQNPYKDITSYNNFYEYGTDKEDPGQYAPKRHKSNPWTLTIDGEVTNKKTLDHDALFKIGTLEERVYRMRCVEGWSVVVPWVGVPLKTVLDQVQPTGKAKYVAFESAYVPSQMLDERDAGIGFPYVEGLRLDEAMNPLTILAVGLYGEMLPAQNGAPIRLVVPWKYGFKGIKMIKKIRLVEKEPPTTWNLANAREYGFFSNVNPAVDHPRWSQASERRLGELLKRKTLPFNGYAEQVQSMYANMDLRKFY